MFSFLLHTNFVQSVILKICKNSKTFSSLPFADKKLIIQEFKTLWRPSFPTNVIFSLSQASQSQCKSFPALYFMIYEVFSLSDKGGQIVFREFLKSEFCEENLDFWLACQDFKRFEEPEELRRRATNIYEEFIRADAPKQVRRKEGIGGVCAAK